MIKAVIFDICGTVVFPGDKKRALIKWEKILEVKKEKQYPVFNKYWYRCELGKMTEGEFFKRFLGELKVRGNIEKLRKILYSINRLNNEIVDMIKTLKEGYTVLGITNNTEEFFEYQRKEFSLDSLFEYVMTSYEARSRKPDQRIYRLLLDIVGLKGEDCVLIDDTRKSLNGAKKLGMKTILFKDNKKLREDFKKIGVSF